MLGHLCPGARRAFSGRRAGRGTARTGGVVPPSRRVVGNVGWAVLAGLLAGCGGPAAAEQADRDKADVRTPMPGAAASALAGGPCDAVIAGLGRAAPAGRNLDLVREITEGTFPRVPLAGAQAAVPHVNTTMATPADYVQWAGAVLDPVARMRALQDAGFRRGVDVGYSLARGDVAVTVVQLKSAAAATRYRDVHLADACEISGQMRRIPGVASGVSYLRGTVQQPMTRAVFVVGDSEVSLTVCGCVGELDPRALVERWARLILDASSQAQT